MSGNYTEEELLLLSNFVYIPACLSERPIAEIIGQFRDADGNFTEESVYPAAASGGMGLSDVRTVFERIDERIEENPDFGTLSVSRKLDENDVRALCYTDAKDKNPVVVFRGTGGTQNAWRDNFEGAFNEDTKIQKIADDFIKNDCGIYTDITVTGHSKGGNLAQYVTVKETEKIGRCVSYDGQGFGDDFLQEYSDAIKAAAPKIKSISAYNDFVNILLTAIAGTCIYVENESSAASAHSPVTLLTENTFDENGDFSSERAQGIVSKELGRITQVITGMLAPLGDGDKQIMSNAAGTAVSLALTSGGEDIVNTSVAPAMGIIAAGLVSKITEPEMIAPASLPAKSVYVDTAACMQVIRCLDEQIPVIEKTIRSVDAIRGDLAYTISSKLCAERALFAACEKLARIKGSIEALSEMIGAVLRRYEQAETEAAALMTF
ncbi:MAG: DUF2974 domain-containing protein [Lachnospiraceae bacterium]|nr:DUF2974 domain-containing protein [Lachnospiraceae bacterium]